jgi:type II secretory pathway component PulF
MVPPFAAMFEDFGARGELPALTRLAIQPVLSGGVTLATLGLASAGAAHRGLRGGAAGTFVIGAGAVVAAAAIPLLVYAMYLPVFEIADAIRAD